MNDKYIPTQTAPAWAKLKIENEVYEFSRGINATGIYTSKWRLENQPHYGRDTEGLAKLAERILTLAAACRWLDENAVDNP